MTFLYGYDLVGSPTATHRHNPVYYGLVNPTSGAGTVNITFTSSGDGVDSGIVAGVAFFTGVDQATPLGPYATATGGTQSGSTIATVTLDGLNGNELVFDSIFRGGTAAQTPGTGQTSLWNTGTEFRPGRGQLRAGQPRVARDRAGTQPLASGLRSRCPSGPRPQPPTIFTMAVNPGGGGTTDPSVGPHTYPEGTVVNIVATPAVGYVFSSWSGGAANPTSANTTVTMDGDKTVTANFTAQNYNLTMAVSPSGGGTTTPAVGTSSQPAGTVVNITAAPNSGYLFSSWTGSMADPNSASTTVTVDGIKTVTANFTAIPPGTVIMEGTPSSGTASPTTSSITFSHTTGTGNNRLLLVGVSWNCGTSQSNHIFGHLERHTSYRGEDPTRLRHHQPPLLRHLQAGRSGERDNG